MNTTSTTRSAASRIITTTTTTTTTTHATACSQQGNKIVNRHLRTKSARGLASSLSSSPTSHYDTLFTSSIHEKKCNEIISTTRLFSFSSFNNTNKHKSSTVTTNTTTTNNNTKALIPINFNIASKITGSESQIMEISLQHNQTLRAESGAMLYMTEHVQMETTTGGGNGGNGGSGVNLKAGLKRIMTGQNFMVSDFTYTGEEGTSGTVALGTDFPSKILRLNLEEYGGKVVCQRGAYLAGSHTVDIEMEFAKKFTTGFFGGEGFVLQALIGEGDVFVKAGGTLIRKELGEGETLRVSSGCLVAFTGGVDFDVQMMPGFKNVLFGGEGLFVTTLTGPGTVWLQGMPPDRMISEIVRRIPGGGGLGLGVPIGMGGGGDGGGGEEGEAGEEESEAAGEEGGAEDMVAATDAAVDADRQATVASSGLGDLGGGDSSNTAMDEDPDSPSALFGDAAVEEETTPSSAPTSSEYNDFNDKTTFSTEDDTTTTDFGEDVTGQQFDDFAQEEDTTTFSTFDEEMSDAQQQGDDEIFDTGSDDVGGDGDEDGGIVDMLKSIWDMFSDDD